MPLVNDLRFALRQLRKSLGFTLIVLATLGLCIGANTAIFSVLDAVLLRSAPYPEPERLALVLTHWWFEGRQGDQISQTGTLFEGVRDHASGLDLAAYGYSGANGVNFASHGRLEHVQQQRVSAGYFRVLGIQPQMGREFTREEDVPGGAAVALLSHGFWQRAFQGDAGVLGGAINLRGEPYTVIGIMPRDFRSAVPVDVWTPLRPNRTGEGAGGNYNVIARVKPGNTWAAASDQLRAISPGLYPTANVPRGLVREQRIVPLQSGLTRNVRTELLVTWVAVLIVLMIGCVNIAGLLLTRSAARSREIATRMALGGGRAAIVRQLFVESLLLALCGGAIGAGIGVLVLEWLKRLGADGFQSWNPIAIDVRVLAAMMSAAALTSLLFGLLPAISASRLDIRSVLIEGGRIAGGRRRWSRQALVVCQVALCLVLLVSAGLLVRTLAYLNGLNPGFDPSNVLIAEVSLQDARYKTSSAVNRLYSQSLDRIRQIPGVQAAGAALTLPYQRPLNDGFRLLDGPDTERHMIETVYATAGFFETLRIPLIAGRMFLESDTHDSAKVVIVSQEFVKRYLQGGNAIGRRIAGPREIIGVVGDVQQHSGLGNFGPISLDPTQYLPVTQANDASLQLIHTWFPPKWVVRSNLPVGSLSAQVQAAVKATDPLLPIAKFQSFDDLQGLVTKDQRYHAALFSIIAGLALLLAAIGLYGLISQSITQRTHELGIRLALGSTAGQAVAHAMRPGILLALAGVAAGCGLSYVAVRFLEHFLWGVRPNDTLTFVATAALLLVVAAVASLVPALRILRLDPARTLRSE